MMAVFPAPIKAAMYFKEKLNAVWIEWFRAIERALPSGDIVDTSSAQTLTNKVINADNNTLSNLDHGAEVDNPSSGVHGVTGSVVGTTDSQTLSAKTLTSPVLNTGLSGTAFLDEDNMASDSATKAASQQSVKAYIDSGTVTMTNKTLTSPVLNTQVTGTAVLDEDNMASNSATKVATQQSIKAYVDASIPSSTIQANAIINGDFNIWQAGTSFAAVANGDYSADMFAVGFAGVMVATISRDTDVPTQAQSNHQSAYSLKVDCTTIDASIDAADAFVLFSKIEGSNFRPFVGKTATLTFWVKSVKTGIYCVAFGNNTDRSYVVEYTINAASTWEKKTITLTFNYAGGTWDSANGTGLWVFWSLATGTNYQGVADTWNSAVDYGTSNQVNFFDNTANDFWLAQVQFELGSTATVFEYRQFGDELAKCQRYYRQSNNMGVVSLGGAGTAGRIQYEVGTATTGTLAKTIVFSTPMRTDPAILIYDNVGAVGKCFRGGNGKNAFATYQGQHGALIYTIDATSASFFEFHYTANARL